MSKKAKIGEIWLVAIPVLLIKEENQLIRKITELPKEQFIEYYKLMLEVFNFELINEIMEKDTTLIG